MHPVSPLSFANQTDHLERLKGDICPFPPEEHFKPVRFHNGAKSFHEFLIFHLFSRFCLNSKSVQEY